MAHAQAGQVLQGTVHNTSGQPVGHAVVHLRQPATHTDLTQTTGSDGHFRFVVATQGAFELEAATDGAAPVRKSLSLAGQPTSQPVDLVLDTAAQGFQFADQPEFTVAGVTDWTAVGGHGSDATLRTSESLAQQTATLLSAPGTARPPVPDEAAARRSMAALLAQHTADGYRGAGDLAEQLGDPLAAVHSYQQAVQLAPTEQNQLALGSELLVHRAIWQAIEVLQTAVAAHPQSAQLQTALGAALFAGARYQAAADHLCRATDLDPAGSTAYDFLGRMQVATPDPLACVEPRLAHYAATHPDSSNANYLYAMALLKKQEKHPDPAVLAQAEALLQRAVAQSSACGEGYLQLGILAAAKRDYATAIHDYQSALAARPDLYEAHYRLAVAYDRTGQHDQARQEFALHDAIKQQQTEATEKQRREVKQFLVDDQAAPSQQPH
ncbi:MAG: tetratricopeptide repeat protein [Acidobacteriota bacterium]|nr:tetratricopeptide repeat protein [Acidobacteriota bacterium]